MSATDSSNGFLPLAPLRHAKPTAVGVWDMEQPGPVTRPCGASADGSADQLVLARLHGQPLAIVHVETPPGAESATDLTAAVWQTASDAVIEHVTAHRCLPGPEDREELAMMLGAGDGECACATPVRPPGEAAVIVCTIGADQEALTRCLRSLTSMDAENFEIVIVDNRPSEPRTRALVDGFVSPVRLRYVAEPLPGLARARNTGVAACDATFVAFTDDDVVVDRSWLARLLEPFSRPEVDAVTGLVMPFELCSAAEKRFEHYAGFGKGVRPEVYDLAEHAASDRFLYPYWGGMFGSGNSMAFRRTALTAAGGFDPALGAGTPTAGGEDIAAFTDVILAGGQLVYQPSALCWHRHRGDEQALRTQVRNYGIGLTAVLWRYLTRDLGFSSRLIASLPSMVRLARSRSDDRHVDAMPADLGRLELQGRLIGPWRYVLSSRQARGAKSADAARHFGGGRRRATGMPRAADERRRETDQAGAQTRT